MKIEKISFGAFQIRKMCKGKMYSVVLDFKLTYKEALKLILFGTKENTVPKFLDE